MSLHEQQKPKHSIIIIIIVIIIIIIVIIIIVIIVIIIIVIIIVVIIIVVITIIITILITINITIVIVYTFRKRNLVAAYTIPSVFVPLLAATGSPSVAQMRQFSLEFLIFYHLFPCVRTVFHVFFIEAIHLSFISMCNPKTSVI